MLRKINRWISVLLLCAILVTALAGCGNSTAESVDNTGNTNTSSAVESTQSGTENNANTQGTQDGSEPVAMGRYVETVTDLSEHLGGWRNRLYRLADGSIIITDSSNPFLISKDNGVTWEEEKSAWRDRLAQENKSILDAAIGADHTAAVIYSDYEEDGSYTQKALLVKSDGTEIPVDIPVTAD